VEQQKIDVYRKPHFGKTSVGTAPHGPVNFIALNRSIVILAQAHNPSILHPSFLSSQKIVPPNWEVADQPVCTPPFSIAKYTNGIVFTAELNKLVILATSPNDGRSLPELATKYVETLPHVHYSAVGINVGGYAECADPANWMIQRFLKRGPGTDEKIQPNALGLKLVYPLNDGTCIVSVDAGTVQLDGGAQVEGLVLGGNYHFKMPKGENLIDVKRAISLFPVHLAHFEQLIDVILKGKC
jgi:hypothetical protein